MTAQSQTRRDPIDRPAPVPFIQTTLTSAQTGGLIVIGAVLWLIAALFIRVTGAGLFVAGNPWLIALFIASLPVGWLLAVLPCRLMGLARPHYVQAATLMAAPALLLDGLAITWLPALYGVGVPGLELGAAWLLWGVGASFAFANLIAAELLPA